MTVPEPAPSPPAEEGPACRNCGETLLGPYCSSCGQEDVDLHRPLQQLAQDAVGDLLNLDTRLLRTLGPLFFRPGFLIREYLAGRRARYVPPLKTFLLASVLFFGLVALLPRTQVTVSQPGEASKETPGWLVNFRISEEQEERSWLDRRRNEARRKIKEHPEEFIDALMANLPRAFFLLLPVFALLLKLLYLRRDRYYIDHLIFALYHHAFAFVILALLVILGRPWAPAWLSAPLAPLLWLWFFLYPAIALDRVYGGSRWKAFFKFSALLAAYSFAFLLALVLLVYVTLLLF